MLSKFFAAAILGAMLFFSLAIVPTVFTTLTRTWAGVFIRRIFPIYYSSLAIASILTSLLASSPHLKLAATLCAFLFIFSLALLNPAINKATDTDNQNRFNLLHRTSVALNLLEMILFIFALWADT